jgi:hypothetical protein
MVCPRKPKNKRRWTLLFTVADVEPPGAITLATRLLIANSGSQTGRACLPVHSCHTANNARAALAGRDLRTLTANHFRRVGDRSAARADGHRLWFLVGHRPTSTPISGLGWRPVQCLTKTCASRAIHFGNGPAMMGPGMTGFHAFLQ